MFGFLNKKFKIKNTEFIDESDLVTIPETNLKYNDIDIVIGSNKEDSLLHIKKDFDVIQKAGIDKLIKSNFIPWLKGEDNKDLDDEEIFNGLKITDISYSFNKIVEKYSPTNKDDYFGEFEFDFVSCNDYTKNLLQASAFVVLVNNDNIYFGNNFDI